MPYPNTPWSVVMGRVGQRVLHHIVARSGETIAIVEDKQFPSDTAGLLAAAPDLREAAEEAIDWFEGTHPTLRDIPGHRLIIAGRLRAAIALAKKP